MNLIGTLEATPKNWWRTSKGPRCVAGAMQVGCNVQNALSMYTQDFYILNLSLKVKMAFSGAPVISFCGSTM